MSSLNLFDVVFGSVDLDCRNFGTKEKACPGFSRSLCSGLGFWLFDDMQLGTSSLHLKLIFPYGFSLGPIVVFALIGIQLTTT